MRKKNFYMEIKFSTKYIFHINKSFFPEMNPIKNLIYLAQKHNKIQLKSLSAILGYPYLIHMCLSYR